MAPRRRSARLVTLTTDIGWAYAAQMKAVLAHYVPGGHVVDLSHDLPAFRVGEAAFLLQHLAGGFPAGTVHVAVIDPGVGGHRVPLIIRCREGSYLVGPDNGVLIPLADRLGLAGAYRIDPARLQTDRRPSATFEGRDVFAPAAGLLAQGIAPEDLGAPWKAYRPTAMLATRSGSELRGTVIHVDRFGNLITDIPGAWLPKTSRPVTVRIGPRPAARIPRVRTYEDLRRGQAGVLVSSFGLVEVSARETRLSDRWRVGVGAAVGLALPGAEGSRGRKTVNIRSHR